jgi:hypothetical protein
LSFLVSYGIISGAVNGDSTTIAFLAVTPQFQVVTRFSAKTNHSNRIGRHAKPTWEDSTPERFSPKRLVSNFVLCNVQDAPHNLELRKFDVSSSASSILGIRYAVQISP